MTSNSNPPTFHLDADIREVSRRLTPRHPHPFYPPLVDRVRAYLWNRMMDEVYYYSDYKASYLFFTSIWYWKFMERIICKHCGREIRMSDKVLNTGESYYIHIDSYYGCQSGASLTFAEPK